MFLIDDQRRVDASGDNVGDNWVRDFGWRERYRFEDRKSTRLNSSHGYISYAVFCLKKKKHRHNIALASNITISQALRLTRLAKDLLAPSRLSSPSCPSSCHP